jgi:hypothetical protein
MSTPTLTSSSSSLPSAATRSSSSSIQPSQQQQRPAISSILQTSPPTPIKPTAVAPQKVVAKSFDPANPFG